VEQPVDVPLATVGPHAIGPGQSLAVIAGPCVIESRDHTMRMADAIARICRKLHIPLVFKSSFDKANRTSVDSYRGPGVEKACEIYAEIRREMDIPVTTDVHLPEQAAMVGHVVDCLQIPAFLCRQTDLLVAAAVVGKCVNVKKGQFMSPEEMAHAVRKITTSGNDNVLLTERGTFFGYNRLVNDMTAIPRMRQFAPVVYDATHSCQHPGGAGERTGGAREFIEPLALAAIAAGASALFIEVHDDPDRAKSDPATQLPLGQLEDLLTKCRRIHEQVS
jgi:2-dehydro-3-deoxyphosphooctonate aldolase (KDO 8-P synthase)